MRSSYRFEECEKWKETLASRLAVCLKKGKARELELGATAIALIVVTLGAYDGDWTEQVCEEFLPLLKQKITGTGGPKARVACLRTLGILCFLGTEDSLVLQQCIEKVQKCVSASASEVRSEAYVVLALLLSVSVPIGKQGRKILDHMTMYLETFTKALEDESVDVRTAAGNALVVLREVFGEILDEEDEGEDGEGEANGGGGGGKSTMEEEVMEKMTRMATSSWTDEGSGTRMNKRDRSSQRRAFRSLAEAMEGKSPSKESKIKLKHGDVLLLDTHSLRVTAGVFRSLLLSGFQVHMQTNDLLHQVFNFRPRQEKIHLSQLEKKMMFSPNSATKKKQTKTRNKDRMQRTAAKLDFYQE